MFTALVLGLKQKAGGRDAFPPNYAKGRQSEGSESGKGQTVIVINNHIEL